MRNDITGIVIRFPTTEVQSVDNAGKLLETDTTYAVVCRTESELRLRAENYISVYGQNAVKTYTGNELPDLSTGIFAFTGPFRLLQFTGSFMLRTQDTRLQIGKDPNFWTAELYHDKLSLLQPVVKLQLECPGDADLAMCVLFNIVKTALIRIVEQTDNPELYEHAVNATAQLNAEEYFSDYEDELDKAHDEAVQAIRAVRPKLPELLERVRKNSVLTANYVSKWFEETPDDGPYDIKKLAVEIAACRPEVAIEQELLGVLSPLYFTLCNDKNHIM